MDIPRAQPFNGPKVLLVRNAAQLAAARRRLQADAQWSSTHGAAGLTWELEDTKTGEPFFIVYIASNPDAAEVMGTIAHEAVHVAKGFFRYIAEDEPGEETMAYTVGAVAQSLVAQFAEDLARKRPKK